MRYPIDKATTRNSLPVRREPYWGAPLSHGLFLGLRKLDDGGTWIARYRDQDGHQRYQSLGRTEFLTYEAAMAATRTWRSAVERGAAADAPETVADLCREYVEERGREKGPSWIRDASQRYRKTVYADPIGAIKVARIRERDVKGWRERLTLTPAGSNRYLAALKAALNYAVRQRYVAPDRALEWTNVRPLSTSQRRDLYLTSAQRRELLDALPDYARPFLHVLCLLPLRPGALAACIVSDFHPKTGRLAIRHDKAAAGRTIPLSPEAVAILKRQAKSKLPGAPLVAYVDGSAWFNMRWHRAIQAALVAVHEDHSKKDLPPGTCAYTLRHSTITDLVVGGLDLLTVARIAGTSVAMIDKHYGHLRSKRATEALSKLAL